MNENLNLVEILKDCPKGTKLYSPLVGEVEFDGVNECYEYPISTLYGEAKNLFINFTKEGLFIADAPNGECTLFPSKDQRDWNKFQPKKPKFDPKTLQPFDRILIKDKSNGKWSCSLFSYIDNELAYPVICINRMAWECSIPYNNDTKHLVGTNDEAPEYYRYWED